MCSTSYFHDKLIEYIICMSVRMYPSLVNCTTIKWFPEWPKTALKEVSSRFLMDVEFGSDEVNTVFQFEISQINS